MIVGAISCLIKVSRTAMPGKPPLTDHKGQVRKKSGDHQIVTVIGNRRNSYVKIKTVGEVSFDTSVYK